jgi:hypothetical protein
MTQLLSLLNQVFDNLTKGNDFEQYISSHKPNSNQQVEQLSRDYLNHHSTSRGAINHEKTKTLDY